MYLADDSVARDAAETARNLTGAQTISPEFLQEFDAFIIPGHALVLPCAQRQNLLRFAQMSAYSGHVWNDDRALKAHERQQPERPTIKRKTCFDAELDYGRVLLRGPHITMCDYAYSPTGICDHL
jgi:hypothetical protein